LYKQDPNGFRIWRKRFFNLQGESIVYFESNNKNDLNNPPLGSISILSITQIIAKAKPGKYNFSIDTPDRIYMLQSETEELMNYWVNGLRAAIRIISSRKSALSEDRIAVRGAPITARDLKPKDGYLYRQAGLLGLYQWYKKWFLLKRGFLFWYSSPEMCKTGKWEGKIPLYKCKLDDAPDSKDHQWAIQIITRSKDKHIIAAEDEEELAQWITAIMKQKIAIEETIDSISMIVEG